MSVGKIAQRKTKRRSKWNAAKKVIRAFEQERLD